MTEHESQSSQLGDNNIPPGPAQLVDQIKKAWQTFDLSSIEQLKPLYHPDIRFIEPAGELQGHDEVFRHFRAVCSNLVQCRFEFYDKLEVRSQNPINQAVLIWKMHFQHARLRGGKPLKVSGATLLQFDQQITLHRDWFDLGEAVYEHIPILGSAIRGVKKRMHG